MVEATTEYNADSMLTLDPMIHIQKRPSLTLGPFDRMQLVALREPIDNSIDEFRAGHGKELVITLHPDGAAQIDDSGRGVPTGINSTTGENGIFMAFGKTGSGGKFGAANSGYSGGASLGLNGVGTTATNATSSRFDTIVYRRGKQFRLSFQNGKPGHFADDTGPDAKFKASMDIVESKDPRSAAEKKKRPSGTTIKFWPNKAIFGNESSYRVEELRESLRSTAFLVPGIKIILDDQAGETANEDRPAIAPQRDEFEFDGGIAEMLEIISPDEKLHETIHVITQGDFKETVPVPQADGTVKPEEVTREVHIDVALRWGTGYDAIMKSYVNTISTPLGGTHVVGLERSLSKIFIDAIKSTRGLLKAKEENPILDDVREGLTAIISINQSEPSFVGQEKQRLGGTNTQRIVQKELTASLADWVGNKKNAAQLKIILQKIVNASRTRLAQRALKDTARRKTALTSSSMPAKLVDCSETGTEGTELLIAEGDSALGTLKLARSSQWQSLLPIRGKILNALKASPADIYANKEVSDIIQVMGAGSGKDFDLEKLRVSRVIIAADADVDGAHIQCLLITMFHKVARPLIDDGRLFVAVPPLYTIKTNGKKSETVYAVDDAEKEKITAAYDKKKVGYEIARLKGLGEMDAQEFWDTTLNPEARTLKRITMRDVEFSDKILSLSMGKEVAPRKEWIMKNRHIVDDSLL